ncbi:MAG TPA: hypothetical protein VJM33_04360, partial [Microthrixaceae bacterium]|nr:hypothetical protein [Microthrixaceae bacterium]
MSDGPGAEAPDVDALRAENERLREELAQRDAAATPKERGRGVRRRWVSVTLAVIGSIMVLLTVFTVWTRNQVLNTDRYVATVSPLASEPVIQDALVARATEEISAAVDFKTLAEDALSVLPERAQVLAGPIASGAESLVERIAREVVESDAFIRLWDEA